MTTYKAVKVFTDLQDNNHKYSVGDEFPRHGLEVTDKRLAELSSSKNKRGCPVIEKIEVETEVKFPAKDDETEAVKPRRKGRKKYDSID